MPTYSMFNILISRSSLAWRDAAASAIAAGIAWVLAVWMFGHPHPVFAAVTAIVCLSPGLPSHGRQAIGLMLGVATGIVVGEVSLVLLPEGFLLPEGLSLLRLTVATFFSILIAAAFGQAAVVAIQSGVSAVLVLALGPHSAGLVRLEDVGVGVVVGLVFSQVLLTPDPLRQIDAAADELLRRLSGAFEACVEALEAQDAHKASSALDAFSVAHDNLIALGAGIDAARYSARWSLRGRLTARAVMEMAALYDQRAIRLYASSLLFGEAFAEAMRKGVHPVPQGLEVCIHEAAMRCMHLSGGQTEFLKAQAPEPTEVEPGWQMVMEHWRSVSEILSSLEEMRRASRPISQPPNS